LNHLPSTKQLLTSVKDVDSEDDEDEYEPEERPKAIPKVEREQKPANRKLADHSRPEINVVEQLVEEVRSNTAHRSLPRVPSSQLTPTLLAPTLYDKHK
jgi:hypothetical protein